MRASHIRAGGATLVAVGVAAVLGACDPYYQVGARQYMPTARPAPDSAQPAPRRRHAPPALDVPRTADCLEAALRGSPVVSDVRRSAPPKYLASYEAGMGVALSDTAIAARPQYANLDVHAWPDERPSVELVFTWIGSSRMYPLAVRREMVRAASALLQQLRAACLPAASDPIECVAEGLGDRKDCVAAP